MQLVSQGDVSGKRVLLRVGFDVTVEAGGQIKDTLRIKQALPTITYLLENKAKLIILSHRGRPNGVFNPAYSLLPVAQCLETFLKKPVRFITEQMEDKISGAVASLQDGEIVMLENLRFHPGEEANDPQFVKWLATIGDIFVNDAFSACHREHASVSGLPGLLPSYAGFGLDTEVATLSTLMEKPDHPVVGIIGGAKLESKLPVITNLLPIVDTILIGSKFVNEKLPEDPKITMPKDLVKNEAGEILDIGPEAIVQYKQIIKEAQTVFWSGPVGLFEDEKYEAGTKELAQAIAGHLGRTIVGGGDTIAAFTKFGLLDQVNFVSTGGSAMLDFLAGKKLPGLEALNKQ